jgi:hypothetical protein
MKKMLVLSLVLTVVAALPFTALATPKPVFTLAFDVVDAVNPKNGLASEYFPSVIVELSRMDTGAKTVLFTTDCSTDPKQGCTDRSGHGAFYGHFPKNATFQIIVYAQGYEKKRIYCDYRGGCDGYCGLVELDRQPVGVSVTVTPRIPTWGGKLTANMTVHDRLLGDNTAELFDIFATLGGESATQLEMNPVPVFARYSQRVNAKTGKGVRTYKEEIDIPADVPNGSIICVYVQVNHVDEPLRGIGSASACTIKSNCTKDFAP